MDSTNRYILDRASSGASEGLVIVADHQSSGRGRLERTWDAPVGASLLMSVLLRPTLKIEELHVLNMAAGVAMAKAVMSLHPQVSIGLKWPNDLYSENRKLGGILTESIISNEQVTVAVGIGVNLDWTPEQLGALGRPAASVSSLVGAPSAGREAVLKAFLDEYGSIYRSLSSFEGRAAISSEYRKYCVTIGQMVSVEMADDSFVGVALDVAPGGELMVAIDSCVRMVSTGDVVHLNML